jgi:hypothetical protein
MKKKDAKAMARYFQLKKRLQTNNYEWNETRKKLRDFARLAQVRSDWHEPHEQEVTAVCKGRTLDNANSDESLDWEEEDLKFSTIRSKVIELRIAGEPICCINLATLLALATNPKLKL